MKRGKKYSEAAKLVDSTMLYDAADAIDLVQKTSTTKFDCYSRSTYSFGC